jgi:hypothetical protein
VDDRDLVRSALLGAVEGPYFPDWEFSTLMAVTREEMAHVLASWPDARTTTPWEADPENVQYVAVNNALNNLVGYPHKKWEQLRAELRAEPADLVRLLEKWRGGPVASYFDAMT